jgi:N-methylhydantoinase B
VLNPGPGQTLLPTHVTRRIVKGDVIRHVTAGGGGFGNLTERDPVRVLDDVLNGKLSADFAQRVYGVAIDARNGQIDPGAPAGTRE